MPDLSVRVFGTPIAQPRTKAWQIVPGYSGLYEASSDGEIRRAITSRRSGNAVPGRIMRQRTTTNGYRAVSLCVSGHEVTCLVHRLVAATFHGPAPFPAAMVNHLDGNKANNDARNLEWCDAKANSAHAVRTGLYPSGDRHGSRTRRESRPRGEANPAAKITADAVRQIRQSRANGETLKSIAARHGISFQNVHRITSGGTWKASNA